MTTAFQRCEALLFHSMGKIREPKIKREVERLDEALQKELHFSGESKNIDFYISALTEYNPFYSTHEIREWLSSIKNKQSFDVKQISLAALRKWNFHKDTGNLEHNTGGFFSIRGLRVKTNIGQIREWSQPIIYQPEFGILGILTKKINGILYFLMQAKAEPGNIHTFQLAPTVQATYSNYTRIHGGKKTPYLEYFLGDKTTQVLIDQLQSEQGARFYHKRNRNIIVGVPDSEEINLEENFRWFTLGQLHRLLQENNIVNMDARSIISEINFAPEKVNSFDPVDPGRLNAILENSPIVAKPISDFGIKLVISSHPNSISLHTMDNLLQKITNEKYKCIIEVNPIPLNKVENWVRTEDEIFHKQQKYFSVIGVRTSASDREVKSWDQPIIKQKQQGIVGFISKEINGILHFLVQLKMEIGVMDILEIAPTVQCITDNYTFDDMPPFTDKFLSRKDSTMIFDMYQSEEGGRFFHESNQNVAILTKDNFPLEEPPFYMWLSLGQLKEFIKFNSFVNVEARSLLSCFKLVS